MVISYITARQAIAGWRALAFLATAPVAVPGIVLGVGLFLSYTRPPFVLYGTLWILLIAFVTIALPAAYQQLQSAFRTVHPDLEEASRILGATRLQALGHITAPLLRTSVIATWCFIFVGVIRELSAAIILFTSETKVISVLIFDLNESGDLGAIAVLGIVMLIITFAVVIAINRIPGFGGVRFRMTSWRNASRNLRRRASGRAHVALRADTLPAAVREKCIDLAVDVVGLCVTARNEDYVRATLAACDDDGPCTAIGHARTLERRGRRASSTAPRRMARISTTRSRAGRCMPARSMVPAVLAACERHNPDGAAALRGIAVGVEVHVPVEHGGAEGGAQGRLSSDRGVRRDGRGGRGRRRRLSSTAKQTVDALGIAGSMAGGIIEYLAEGAWTKRMHAGWAAQSGLRAALMARAGFLRSAHRVRGHARAVPRLRAHDRRQLRRADSAISGSAGSPRRSRSSPIPAGR